jgi:hypothetical protein
MDRDRQGAVLALPSGAIDRAVKVNSPLFEPGDFAY